MKVYSKNFSRAMFAALVTVFAVDANALTVVAPSGKDLTEGGTKSIQMSLLPQLVGGFEMNTVRIQHGIGSSLFSSEPGPVVISAIRFRLDGGSAADNNPGGPASAFTATVPTVKVMCCTTSAGTDAFSTTFASNLGLDLTTVLERDSTISGPGLTISSAGAPYGTVKPFDIEVPFDTPFVYNPLNGNLLIDLYRAGQPLDENNQIVRRAFDWQSTTGDEIWRCSYSLANPPLPATGSTGTSNAIMQIVYSQATELKGQVELQDWYGQVNGQIVTLELLQSGVPVETHNVALDSNGNYSLYTGLSGTFDIRVKSSHWLAKQVNGVTVTPLSVTNNFSLVNGDVDGDNAVTIFDYSALSTHFDMDSSAANWNTVDPNTGTKPSDSDLDGDEFVSIFDYSILSTNFDQMGD